MDIRSTSIFANICDLARKQGYIEPQNDLEAFEGLIEYVEIDEEILPVALRILAKCYTQGYCSVQGGIAKDEEKAFYLFRKSAELGDVFAKQRLARCYQLGIGTEQNTPQAFFVLHDLITSNTQTAKSLCRFAMLRPEGPEGRTKSSAITHNLFKVASESGSLTAESYRGFCHLNGHGVKKNREMALQILEKTAEQDSFYGIYHLIKCYSKVVNKDMKGPSGDPTGQKYYKTYIKMASLMQRLINKRDFVDKRDEKRIGMIAEAIEALIVFYQSGLGVPQDLARIVSLRNQKEELLNTGLKYVVASSN